MQYKIDRIHGCAKPQSFSLTIRTLQAIYAFIWDIWARCIREDHLYYSLPKGLALRLRVFYGCDTQSTNESAKGVLDLSWFRCASYQFLDHAFCSPMGCSFQHICTHSNQEWHAFLVANLVSLSFSMLLLHKWHLWLLKIGNICVSRTISIRFRFQLNIFNQLYVEAGYLYRRDYLKHWIAIRWAL